MYGSRVIGTGHFLPDRVVTNDDLAQMFDTNDAWIRQRTGIEERRWVDGNVGPCDLAEHAAKQALAQAGLTADDIDLIVFATLSPDYNFPGSGCLLQARLGCRQIPAFDIRNQCSGFLYALSMADQFLRSGTYTTALVVGAEVHSSGLDLTDRGRNISVLFGDGAGATLLQRTSGDERILTTHLHADGRGHRLLSLHAPASCKNPRLTPEMMDAGLHFPYMDGPAVFKRAVTYLPKVISQVLEAEGLAPEEIALLVPHQANYRINNFVAQKLGFSPGQVFHNIQRYGNTTAASIPIALSEAHQQGRLSSGDLVLLAAFGSGLTWGASLLRWG